MREGQESAIRAACEARDYAAAATAFIEAEGAEILGFLRARMKSDSAADEVFATFAEKLWVGLPGFEWRSTLRSWAYRLARNAAIDYATAAHNRPGKHQRLSQDPLASALAEQVRTTTALYRRTAVKDRMRELRETLPDDDQMLLILRVDRGMDFRELAVAMAASEIVMDAAQIDREAARLRKRFERIKEQLRELARDAGLI